MALAATQARLGAACPVVVWSRQDYRCIPGSAIRRQDLSPGGYQINSDFRFEALVSSFLSDSILDADDLKSALLQTHIIYLGANYKVTSVAIRPSGLQILCECHSLDQNA